MRYLLIGVIGASLTLTGCSKEHGLSTEELVIEGGGGNEPDGGINPNRDVHGTVTWDSFCHAKVRINLYDANGNLLADTFVVDNSQQVVTKSYNFCGEDLWANSGPYPWYLCAEQENTGPRHLYDQYQCAEEIDSLDFTGYGCNLTRKTVERNFTIGGWGPGNCTGNPCD